MAAAPKMLHQVADQAESHKLLEKEQRKHPLAECRINHGNPDAPFEVWSGPDPRSRLGAPHPSTGEES